MAALEFGNGPAPAIEEPTSNGLTPGMEYEITMSSIFGHLQKGDTFSGIVINTADQYVNFTTKNGLISLPQSDTFCTFKEVKPSGIFVDNAIKNMADGQDVKLPIENLWNQPSFRWFFAAIHARVKEGSIIRDRRGRRWIVLTKCDELGRIVLEKTKKTSLDIKDSDSEAGSVAGSKRKSPSGKPRGRPKGSKNKKAKSEDESAGWPELTPEMVEKIQNFVRASAQEDITPKNLRYAAFGRESSYEEKMKWSASIVKCATDEIQRMSAEN